MMIKCNRICWNLTLLPPNNLKLRPSIEGWIRGLNCLMMPMCDCDGEVWLCHTAVWRSIWRISFLLENKITSTFNWQQASTTNGWVQSSRESLVSSWSDGLAKVGWSHPKKTDFCHFLHVADTFFRISMPTLCVVPKASCETNKWSFFLVFLIWFIQPPKMMVRPRIAGNLN